MSPFPLSKLKEENRKLFPACCSLDSKWEEAESLVKPGRAQKRSGSVCPVFILASLPSRSLSHPGSHFFIPLHPKCSGLFSVLSLTSYPSLFQIAQMETGSGLATVLCHLLSHTSWQWKSGTGRCGHLWWSLNLFTSLESWSTASLSLYPVRLKMTNALGWKPWDEVWGKTKPSPKTQLMVAVSCKG